MTAPEETPQGDYIEAALHALRANRPDTAKRYLIQALGADRLGAMDRLVSAIMFGHITPAQLDSLGGETDA